MSIPSVAVIEDNAAYRGLLETMFRDSGRYALAGSFASSRQALSSLPADGVDFVVLDVHLGAESGLVALGRLREHWPHTRYVILTSSEADRDLFSALEAGASGYLLKSDSRLQLVLALDELAAGGAPLSRSIARRVLASFSQRSEEGQPASLVTRREREIMQRLAEGSTDKEIAKLLGISRATVKNHLYRIYEKLGVRSRTEAVVKWLKR